MPYLNRIEVMGNLGKDPELRYLSNQTPVTTISLAYVEKWRDKATNEPRERIEWFHVVLYGKQAETVCRYMKKGDCLWVAGKMQSRPYNHQGVDKKAYEIIAGEMQIIHTSNRHSASVDTADLNNGIYGMM